MIFYHGTSDAYLAQILKNGLNAGCGFTRERARAVSYAHDAASWDREVNRLTCQPVLIALDDARIPPDARGPDVNSIAFETSADGALERAMGIPTREDIARDQGLDLTCWHSVMTYTGTFALVRPVGIQPADVHPLADA